MSLTQGSNTATFTTISISKSAFGQPPEKGIEWARYPDLMQKNQELAAKRAADK